MRKWLLIAGLAVAASISCAADRATLRVLFSSPVNSACRRHQQNSTFAHGL